MFGLAANKLISSCGVIASKVFFKPSLSRESAEVAKEDGGSKAGRVQDDWRRIEFQVSSDCDSKAKANFDIDF